MKKLIFILFGLTLLLSACQKEPFAEKHRSEDVFLKIKHWEGHSGKQTGITLQQVDSCLAKIDSGEQEECFSISDLVSDFLPIYGTEYPDIIPVTDGYRQDVNFCSLGRINCFTYQRNEDGTTSWLGTGGIQWDSTQWIIPFEVSDGVWEEQLAGTGPSLQFQTYTIPCDGYQPACNGNHFLTLRSWYQGAEYVNAGEIFILINNVPYNIPQCNTGPDIPLWYDPNEEIIFFPEPYPCLVPGTAKGDYNGDFKVNTSDLLILISNLCNS